MIYVFILYEHNFLFELYQLFLPQKTPMYKI